MCGTQFVQSLLLEPKPVGNPQPNLRQASPLWPLLSMFSSLSSEVIPPERTTHSFSVDRTTHHNMLMASCALPSCVCQASLD